ncbi:GntR family transcriptional regulator [Labrys wisconsinensis]|uniref:DNA-binding GntR family transcriptional regulator n=1 Tax=Labrys wisconsinensis TaxID=425677 RepID=A0ABU0J905_9HYPH|nr:GntR family transcriptional regulator [Labrys wisconsinensis]MDQ0470752.1 DNA-binding GntR family transcriptional regulator [Labrys wisconsinensis]
MDFEPVADTTRRAEIVALLKRAILAGQLAPGHKLNELRIAEQMRVSRAPLREAMRELVQQGLLTSIPYAGTFVIDVTAKDIDDAYSINKVLDDFAIERTWPVRNARFFAELDRRHEAVKQATRDRDTARQIETALQLHGVIYEWADNAVLLETWQRLTSRLQMYFALHQRARNEPVPAEDLHEDYVRLLKGDDMQAAQRHAREHIDFDFEHLIAYARSLEQRPAQGRADRGARSTRPAGLHPSTSHP